MSSDTGTALRDASSVWMQALATFVTAGATLTIVVATYRAGRVV